MHFLPLTSVLLLIAAGIAIIQELHWANMGAYIE
jgi:hypothetical protein